jgi:hypothetical protein
MCIQHLVHRSGRHHPRKQAGRQIVTEPGAFAQHRLGPRHVPPLGVAATWAIVAQSYLNEQYCSLTPRST